MKLGNLLLLASCLASSCAAARFAPGPKERRFNGEVALSSTRQRLQRRSTASGTNGTVIAPKFFILSLFYNEGDIWLQKMPGLLDHNITVPGISPLFPEVHCRAALDVCQITLGEGASSTSALIYSGLFDLRKTYFMVAGIAGINPHVATTGSVTFSRYAVQFDLQYEFDARQTPKNDSSGYFPQDAYYPDVYTASAGSSNQVDYPGSIYGTEAFELNENLRNRFISLAKTNTLANTAAATKYRKTYGYAPADQPPAVVACDTGTSNVYWSGSTLGDAFSNYTLLLTNGTGNYCATQQEDNAVLEVLTRADLAGKVDFSRAAVMRTASDFDRAPPTETEVFHLLYANQEGFEISIRNIYIAGHPIIHDVVTKWNTVYEKGIPATNYIGDLFNTLDKPNPDIGTPSIYIN